MSQSIHTTPHFMDTPAQQNRWLIWIDAAELLAGRNLRSDDRDLDNALNAYLGGDSPASFARTLSYPPPVSAGLLRLLVWLFAGAALVLAVCLA